MNDTNQSWKRKSAIEVHDRKAGTFEDYYRAQPGRSHRQTAFEYGRHHIDLEWNRVLSEVALGGAVLDVGCGVGTYVRRALDVGYNVIGVEPSEAMYGFASRRLPLERLIHGSVQDLPFDDDAFEFVYAIEVFRYLSEADNYAGLAEIRRVLKPRGLFFATYVNRYAMDGWNLLVQVRKLRAKLTHKPMAFHTDFRTPITLTRMLHGAGFNDVKTLGAMFAPLRLFYKLGPLGPGVAALVEPLEPWLGSNPHFKALSGHLMGVARANK